MSQNAAALTPVPVLFVSHGSPMFALDAGTSGPALTAWAQAQAPAQALRGVVIMSPHWMAPAPAVMTNPAPATWHDFGGFPAALYQLQYPAPGSHALGHEVLDLLQAAGLGAQADARRPLDHGAWVPLMHLYPKANVPVVQVALPATSVPSEVYALGQALASLRSRGVLLVGSGSMTHNLSEFGGGGDGGGRQPSPEAAPYVLAFSRWVEQALLSGDAAALLNYEQLAPQARRAHPSTEHFLPLFFALGAANWGGPVAPKIDYLSREVMYRILAMDAFALH